MCRVQQSQQQRAAAQFGLLHLGGGQQPAVAQPLNQQR
jgi:hypothetical protein